MKNAKSSPQTESRVGIAFDKDDLALFDKLAVKFGNIGKTAIVRIAIRELARQK